MPWISLRSNELAAEIDPLGAQLSVLRDRAGRDLQWNGDPAIWNGRAPLLFPIVGALAGGRYRLGTETYPLARHGFARNRLFEEVSRDSSRATFALKSDATSLSVYPFRFELTVQFALAGAALTVTTSVKNTGDADLPASIGYHPAFCWPLPFGQARAAHFIEFAQDEAAPIRRLDGAGLLLSEGRPTPVVGRRLALTDELFRDDVMIFDNLRSRYLTYGAEEGPRIRIDYPDSPYLGVWTKPGANFICIEPWHGVADPEDYAGDFRAKPGVFLVAAGAAHAATLCITLLEHAG